MSAWLCTDEHIFEMAKYYVDHCQDYANHRKTFKEVARIFYNENCNSLGARYGDEFPDIKIPDIYRPIVKNIHHMAKMVNCYSYQSCEHDGWEKSEANAMCDSILYSLLSTGRDYEQAPWGFDRDEYIEKFA